MKKGIKRTVKKKADMTSESLGMHRPLHKIQGNKFKLLPKIASVLNKVGMDNNSTWVEPFMGTGVVGFNLAPENAYFYDINPHIINLYKGIKDRSITLNHISGALLKYQKLFLGSAPIVHEDPKVRNTRGDEVYKAMRAEFNKTHCPILFLVLNRTGFNGLVRFSKREQVFNTPYCKNYSKITDSLIDSMMESYSKISYKIKHQNWNFESLPFDQALSNHRDDKNTVAFCDPPYIGRNTQYFTGWDIEDEALLHSLLANNVDNFLLTTWFNEYSIEAFESANRNRRSPIPLNPAFEKYWNQYERLTFPHKYTIAGGQHNVGVYEAIVYK